MKLEKIRIRFYKTLAKEEGQEFDFNSGLTLIGPNSSGKTNILEAIRMFFTNYENKFHYQKDVHLSFGYNRKQTTIVCTFSLLETDTIIKQKLKECYDLLDLFETERKLDSFQLHLLFSGKDGNPIYRIYPNKKKPQTGADSALFSRRVKSLASTVIDSFSIHYVPSFKSIDALYNELLLPVIRKEVASNIKEVLSTINSTLKGISNEINAVLSNAKLENLKADIVVPNDSIIDLLKDFEINLNDNNSTSLFSKGLGIQFTTIFSSLKWMTESETKDGKNVIWLIEEPESYLHPSLYCNVKIILDELTKLSTVILSTHSLGFVPKDPLKIVGTSILNGNTEIKTYKSYAEATKEIRNNIGVKFTDFYNFNEYNILVEGKTDREYLNEIISRLKNKSFLPQDQVDFYNNSNISILDFGGVSFISGFLRASWPMFYKEENTISLFDGDTAGLKEVKALQKYFGNQQIRFEANKDFIIVRKDMAIEGLFPDLLIKEIYNEHSNWFDEYVIDSENLLCSLKIKDSNKEQYKKKILEKIDSSDNNEWTHRWLHLLENIKNKFKSI